MKKREYDWAYRPSVRTESNEMASVDRAIVESEKTFKEIQEIVEPSIEDQYESSSELSAAYRECLSDERDIREANDRLRRERY